MTHLKEENKGSETVPEKHWHQIYYTKTLKVLNMLKALKKNMHKKLRVSGKKMKISTKIEIIQRNKTNSAAKKNIIIQWKIH